MQFRTCVLIALACFLLPSAAPAQRSAREMAELHAPETALVIRQDFEALLESTLLFENAVINRRRGDSVWIPGRPIGTRRPGLCQRQYVTMYYELTRAPRPAPNVLPGGVLSGPWDNPRDIERRPAGFGVGGQFFFVTAPGLGPFGLSYREPWEVIAAPECPLSLTLERGWFTAENEVTAVLAVRALQQAAAAVASGAIALDCAPRTAPNHTTCEAELQRIASDVRALGAIRMPTSEEMAAEIEIDNFTLTIRSSWPDANGTLPIRSIRMELRSVVLVE